MSGLFFLEYGISLFTHLFYFSLSIVSNSAHTFWSGFNYRVVRLYIKAKMPSHRVSLAEGLKGTALVFRRDPWTTMSVFFCRISMSQISLLLVY